MPDSRRSGANVRFWSKWKDRAYHPALGLCYCDPDRFVHFLHVRVAVSIDGLEGDGTSRCGGAGSIIVGCSLREASVQVTGIQSFDSARNDVPVGSVLDPCAFPMGLGSLLCYLIVEIRRMITALHESHPYSNKTFVERET